MIVIEHIKWFEFRGSVAEIMHESTPSTLIRVDTDDGGDWIEAKVLVEKIHGERFRRPSDGTDIVIGCSKGVADLIGIQYEAWGSTKSALTRSLDSLAQFHNAGWWQRLRFLFTGKIA